MKVPFTTASQNHLSANPKQGNNNVRSSSPVAGKPATKTEFPAISEALLSQYSDELPLQVEDEHGVNNHFEDWDSLMRELGLHDDSTLTSKSIPQLSHCDSHYPVLLPEFLPPSSHSFDSPPTQFIPSDFDLELNNVGLDFLDELIRVAECFETNAFELAHVILSRLNLRLRSPAGKPLQRAAYYFKEALQSLLTGSTRLTRAATSSEVVQTIEAYKTFSNVSPIPMFSNLTANQAILEAVEGLMIVHVIDFDIGLGGHWASFMKEIADKSEYRKSSLPVLRISAVVPEEYGVESRLIRDNLYQFARELKIGFDIAFVSIRTFEFLYFKAIKFVEGEKTAVLLSPAIFRRIGPGFVNDLRRISPHVVVHVETEGLMSGSGTSSFRQTVIDGLEFYSTLFESLEAANVGGGGGADWIRKIETFVLLPKIFAAVDAVGRRVTPWTEAFTGAGMRPVVLSRFADFQAEYLLRTVQVRGFHVAKRHGGMVLCWQERAMVATSAWKF